MFGAKLPWGEIYCVSCLKIQLVSVCVLIQVEIRHELMLRDVAVNCSSAVNMWASTDR